MVAKKATKKRSVKKIVRKRAKTTKTPDVQVYKVKPHAEPKKKASQGYIKHSIIALIAAAITAFIIRKIFFWRKKD